MSHRSFHWKVIVLILVATLQLFGTTFPTFAGPRENTQANRWQQAKLDPRRSIELDKAVILYARTLPRYQAVEHFQQNGVPAPVIFGLHYREASNSFTSSLAQGDRLTARSIHVPRGRIPGKPPPYTWEEAANDALYSHELDYMQAKDWSNVGSVLQNIESYNGLGYQRKGVVSPYVYAGTDQYKRGKYTGDGRYDTFAIDRQLGVAAILKQMEARGIKLPFD